MQRRRFPFEQEIPPQTEEHYINSARPPLT